MLKSLKVRTAETYQGFKKQTRKKGGREISCQEMNKKKIITTED